jgi:hypothetical protein
VFVLLLPFIEQSALWDKFIANQPTAGSIIPGAGWQNGFKSMNGSTGLTNPVFPANPITMFLCPADPAPAGYAALLGVGVGLPATGTGIFGNPTGAFGYGGFTDYVANYLVFGNAFAADPQNHTTNLGLYSGQRSFDANPYYLPNLEGNARLETNFPDGTANTILFTERMGSAWMSSSVIPALWAYSGDGFQSNFDKRATFCDFKNQQPNVGAGQTLNPLSTTCALFQTFEAIAGGVPVDSFKASSFHFGGIPVCLADGSVRFIINTVNATTWANACHPSDGNVLDSDW